MELATPEQRAVALRDSRKTLHLATVGADGTPTASYAPFVRQGPNFFIYTSELSRHTKDMFDTRKASVLLIEDEVGATNLFARKRITLPCSVEIVEREENVLWRHIMNLFEKTFGDIFGIIRPLTDFTLFCLVPHEAIYVEGFGQAYRMSPDLFESEHIRGTGPGAHRA